MWHKMLMTNLCFEQIASLIIDDKTKVRTKIFLSPVQDSKRLLYCKLLKRIKGQDQKESK